MKLLSEGAEAKIYLLSIFGTMLLVKKRHAKPYRASQLDILLRKTRTKKEAHAMLAAKKAGVSVPAVYATGSDEIYMEFVKGVLMRDSVFDQKIIADVGIELAKLHNAGIAHGDFTPANILLTKDGVCVIDLGLAEPNAGIEEKAIDLLLMKRSLPKEFYLIFENAYAKAYAGSSAVLHRLAEIEKRGRYQARTIANV
ncbi:MAG: KEOPS complex kinase/ATPase Bud32 [Candidatus Micrarchaeia archaeon]